MTEPREQHMRTPPVFILVRPGPSTFTFQINLRNTVSIGSIVRVIHLVNKMSCFFDMRLYPPLSERFLHHCLQSLRFSARGQMIELYLYLSCSHPLFCSVLIDWKIYNTATVSPIQNQLHCYCGNKHNTTGTKKWQTQHQKCDDCVQLSHMLLSNKKNRQQNSHFWPTLLQHIAHRHMSLLWFSCFREIQKAIFASGYA